MVIVILKNPDPEDPERRGANVELRVMIEGMTVDEADDFGEAINDFAIRMKRRQKLEAFTLDQELMVN
jgi:hypothetical protein